MRRGPARFFAIGLAVIFVSFISGCATIFSATLYDRLTLVAPDCGGGYSGATPASFRAWVDSTPYLMPDYQDVRFPSRDPAITIDAWWIPGPTADAPAVVLAHGLHECTRATTVLFPSVALLRQGYAVLVIDLRNEGSSKIDNGRETGGTGEARDMLGAWDWLRDAKGLAAGRIGLFGCLSAQEQPSSPAAMRRGSRPCGRTVVSSTLRRSCHTRGGRLSFRHYSW